jgi:hypothetical protein
MKHSMFVKMKYDIVAGENWDLVEGDLTGTSQGGCLNLNKGETIVWNMSFNAMYRTLDIHGWPKLVMSFTGPDSFGTEIVKGYATCSIPVSPGSHDIHCHIFRPVQPKYLGLVLGSQKVEKDKEVDVKAIAMGRGREVSTVEHMGTLRVSVDVSHKNFKKFGIMV